MDDEHPEWLPVDWKVCVRVRNSGKKDKYYVNPSMDLKFNSKLEVLRHLSKAEKDLKLKKLNKVEIKTSVAERLPSGWTKEIRIIQNGGKTRKEPFYIDPVSGGQFRSTREVRRYLETKNSGKVDDDPSQDLGDHCKPSTARAEGQKVIDTKVDKTSSGNETVKPDNDASKSINTRETDASGQLQKENDSTAVQQQEKAAVQKKRKKHSKWMNDLPRRSSKRLARVEADPPLEEAKTSSGARAAATLIDEAKVDTNLVIDKSKVSSKAEVDTTVNLKEASTNLPPADLSSGSVDSKEDEKNLESSLDDLLMDPCIEFAIKTLTGAIPLEDVNRIQETRVGSEASPVQASASSSSSVLPFSDLWADPCFEFAVKTLTSEIPVEDASHFQIAFHQVHHAIALPNDDFNPRSSSTEGINGIDKCL